MEFHNQQGLSQLDLEAFNLVTRIAWVAQRSDVVMERNGFDNYTNWDDHAIRPIMDAQQGMFRPTEKFTMNFSSGVEAHNADPKIIQRGTILVGGKERLTEKTDDYFSLVQHYRHNRSIPAIPGISCYSFALNNWSLQPSGAINASMFDSVQLRLDMLTPPIAADPRVPTNRRMIQHYAYTIDPVTFQKTQKVISCKYPATHSRPYAVFDVVPSTTYAYNYNVRVYIESYNILRFASGLAALVYSH